MSDKKEAKEQKAPAKVNEDQAPGHFDKFMEDITRREEEARQRHQEYVDSHKENPQLERNRLYRELPQNKTRWRK